MLIAAVIVAGVIVGYICGGRLKWLFKTDIRGLILPIIAFATDFAAQPLLNLFNFPENFIWIFVTVKYLLLLIFILLNLFGLPFCLLGLGTVFNFAVIALNGFAMPVSRRVLQMAGENADKYISMLQNGEIYMYRLADENTLLPFLGDIIKVPLLGGFASVGDLLLGAGVMAMIIMGMTGRGRRKEKTAFSRKYYMA